MRVDLNNSMYIFKHSGSTRKKHGNKKKIADLYYNCNNTTDAYKWAVFVTKDKIVKDIRSKLESDSLYKINNAEIKKPKGYWYIMDGIDIESDKPDIDGEHDQKPNDDEMMELTSIPRTIAKHRSYDKQRTLEPVPQQHLHFLFLLLHYYYKSHLNHAHTSYSQSTDDPLRKHLIQHSISKMEDTSLNERQRTLRDNQPKLRDILGQNEQGLKRMDPRYPVIFQFDQYKYRLTYWNKRGKYQCTALGIEILETPHKLRKSRTQIHNHLNGKTSIPAKGKEYYFLRFCTDFDKVDWQWFDNDEYRKFMDYDKNNTKLIQQLEVSFLANDEKNFNPKEFKGRFSNVLLPNLKTHLFEKFKPKRMDIYSTLNMQQIEQQ